MENRDNIETTLPVEPSGLTPEDKAEVEGQVSSLVKSVDENSEERVVVSEMEKIGLEAQIESARRMELLKGRVGDLLKDVDGEGSPIPSGLVELRTRLDEINPHKLSAPGWFGRLIGKTPAIGKALKKIAVRYEEVNTQIDVIVNSLREGEDQLLRDNSELDELYDRIKEQQHIIQKNAYVGEMLMKKLEELLSATEDPAKRQRVEAALNAVAIRTQDLRTMEQVNQQFFVSIDMTIANNKMLSHSIRRTLTVTTNLITVGLSIQAALVKQKKVMEATKATQEYAADILTANAASIKQHTKTIGNMYKDPVIALDKVKQAFDDLMTSMDELDRVKREGVASAKEGINELNQLSAKLAPKVKSLEETRKSIEGSPTNTLPEGGKDE